MSALNMPHDVIPSDATLQSSRGMALLEWAEGSTGCDICEIFTILASHTPQIIRNVLSESNTDEPCETVNHQQLGEHHLNVVNRLNDLAVIYHLRGRYEEAVLLLQRILTLNQQRFGESHPNVAFSLNNLATLYKAQGRYEEAETLYQQALEMRLQLLGENHPDVTFSLNNLAHLYDAQGCYEEPNPYFSKL